jgi:preprotein translocase subunit SecF
LIIGVFIGTYSSIYIASPVLIYWENLRSRKQAKTTSRRVMIKR